MSSVREMRVNSVVKSPEKEMLWGWYLVSDPVSGRVDVRGVLQYTSGPIPIHCQTIESYHVLLRMTMRIVPKAV